MRFTTIATLSAVFVASQLAAANAHAELISFPDGMTVYDTNLKARWLANANLPGTRKGKAIASVAGITTITPGGSMDYDTALAWVNALNTLNQDGEVGYLGHNTWTLPTTPAFGAADPDCTSHGAAGSGFGYGCTGSDMGALYNLKTSLGLQYPNTAVPIPDTWIGPFHNFQPYLYWSNDQGHTFSFNTGWAGSNTPFHYMYVLPMIEGQVQFMHGAPVTYWPAGVGTLQVSTDRQLVYDPDAPYIGQDMLQHMGVTWLADADLARSHTFGMQCASYVPSDIHTVFPPGIPCIAPDGSMANDTAHSWIAGMNVYKGVGWLGQSNWQLPPRPSGCENIGCVNTPMGELYRIQLGLSPGTPVVSAPDIKVGPFKHLQPYLYWSCSASQANPPCSHAQPVNNQEWSFSFGNGMQDTDILPNNLYVMVYFPQTPAQALEEAIAVILGNTPEYNAFESQAAAISSAPNAQSKAGRLRAFINHVDAQRGRVLTDDQAAELVALAQVI